MTLRIFEISLLTRVVDVLHDWMSDIQDPFLSQAACTAVQVALVDLLASWNIKPTRVIGHSSGEIAAAYCAGKISRKDAWKLAYFRGYVSSKQINRAGAMLAVGTSSEAIQPYLDAIHSQEGRRGKLAVACFNSPNNFTVSGDEEEIDILHSSLAKDAVFSKKLAVRNAYHSYHMQDVAETYLDLIGDLSAPPPQDREPRVEMISTVSASSLCESEAQSANYWVKNLVSPVRFSDALVAMSTAGETTGQTRLRLGTKGPVRIHHVVEIGSHSALRSAVRETLASVKGLSMIEYHHVLTRNELTPAYLLSTAAGLYCHGYPVAMNVVNNCEESQNARTPQLLTSLPPYEFNHSRKYWAESRLSKNYRHRELPRHDLCGAKVADWNPEEPRWRGFLRISELPWLKDHEVIPWQWI
jgi:acyl transferase domain-containing protein